jgi:uncharacterized membrane protein
MAAQPSSRLAYIDWLRGLACLLMFQTHCYDAWLGAAARNSKFFMWSQILGTFPAPLFLLLAGISFALVTDKLIKKGLPASQIAKTTIRRGAEIFALGILFRIQEFAIAWGWAPWSDLFRVDILNSIGIAMMLMGLLCWAALRTASSRGETGILARPDNSGEEPSRGVLILCAVLACAGISMLAPLLWTTWRPSFLPWPLESYINGVHNLNQPQPWLFPVFPWAAFAFAGLAAGFVLISDRARELGARIFFIAGVAGVALIYLGRFLDSSQVQLYPVYDFWHTSPNFFLIRVGFLLLLVLAAYAWCRWGLGTYRFSPLIQLGQTSLLVYWVHIEFVYGRFHILQQRSQSIAGASRGLLIIFLSMLILSILRTKWKKSFALPSLRLAKSSR